MSGDVDPRLDVSADLRVEFGDPGLHAHVRSENGTLVVDASDAAAIWAQLRAVSLPRERPSAREAVRNVAEGLAEVGLRAEVRDHDRRVATIGRGVDSSLARLVVGTRHVSAGAAVAPIARNEATRMFTAHRRFFSTAGLLLVVLAAALGRRTRSADHDAADG